MGKVVIFTGQAGTGKTTALMNLLGEIVPQRTWSSFESVLALTFMHGSRKRLDTKLQFLKTDLKVKFKCATIDSFSVALVNRFRCYLNIQKPIKVNPAGKEIENQYEIQFPLEHIQKFMISILAYDSVRKYIANTYPYIVIDEFQDCTGNLLEIVKQLAESTDLLIAADPFQQLSNDENSEGMNWIRANQHEHSDLDRGGVKRTKNGQILNTAACLRTDKNIQGKKIYIGISVSKHLTSSYLFQNIHYNIRKGTIAIISPTKKSKFVVDAIKCLADKHTFKSGPNKGKIIGPYGHLLHADEFINTETLIKNISKEPLRKNDLKRMALDSSFILKRAAEVLLKKLSMRNMSEIPYEDFCFVVQQLSHTYDNFYRKESQSTIIFTTIHGAKNREFETVIILWPYEVSGNILYKRKLLYNAVTRAKGNALIIVQRGNMNKEELANDELFGLIFDKPEQPILT